MSSTGQPDGDQPLPTALVLDLDDHDRLEWHAHDVHQLAWATHGTLILSLDGTSWVLPSTRAAWIPAGMRHAVVAAGDTRMLSVYVDAADRSSFAAAPMVVDAMGLLGELARHLARTDLGAADRGRAEAVLSDLLVPLPMTVLPLPMPTDDSAREVASRLLANPADRRSLDEWGRLVGASARTLARRFSAETGMGFARWSTNARLTRALPLLADGRSVAWVSAELGYANPSAFVAAFRRELGTTPAQYFRRRR